MADEKAKKDVGEVLTPPSVVDGAGSRVVVEQSTVGHPDMYPDASVKPPVDAQVHAMRQTEGAEFADFEASGVADNYRALHANGRSWEEIAKSVDADGQGRGDARLAAFCRSEGRKAGLPSGHATGVDGKRTA